jgi:hypothetical protein
MLSHPGFIMNTRGADQAVAHGGTDALPGLGTIRPFAPNQSCRRNTYELLVSL